MPNDKEVNPVTGQRSTERNNPSEDEQNILREVSAALKSIRFGSILLIIHEGRLVEVTKTVRSRFNSK